jgi:hypothetical protein
MFKFCMKGVEEKGVGENGGGTQLKPSLHGNTTRHADTQTWYSTKIMITLIALYY